MPVSQPRSHQKCPDWADNSPDRKFTFKPVNCVGACALAPVMIVDGTYYDGVTPDSAISILHEIAEGKKVLQGAASPES